MQSNNKDEYPQLTIGELKNKISGYSDDCLVHFSSIGGKSPTLYKIKNWARDGQDNVTEIIIEFDQV